MSDIKPIALHKMDIRNFIQTQNSYLNTISMYQNIYTNEIDRVTEDSGRSLTAETEWKKPNWSIFYMECFIG